MEDPRAPAEREVTPGAASATATTYDVEAVQRRTLRTLMAAQMVGAVGITIGIATASLLARDLSGSEKLAGLAQTFQDFDWADEVLHARAAFLRLLSAQGLAVTGVDTRCEIDEAIAGLRVGALGA